MALVVIIGGTEYNLDDGTLCYWVGDDGLGMAPLHRFSERGPLQHGSTDRGFRLDTRIVRLVLDAVGNDQATWEANRLALLSIFKPSNNPIILRFDLQTRTYYLDCHYIGDMSMPAGDRLGHNQTIIVSLRADDPCYYGASEAATWLLGGGTDTMLVPTVIPMTVGASTIDSTQTLIYEGTFIDYPIIRITGPITNCIITNNTTGETLDFTGTTIAAGDYYDIDLRYGYKTVKDSAGANQIGDLTSTSDLSTWHLECDPTAPGGINSINVSGSGVTAATIIEITYTERYIGI